MLKVTHEHWKPGELAPWWRHTHLPMRHFCSWRVWSWQRQRGEPLPPLQRRSRAAGVHGGVLNRRSSSLLQAHRPRMPDPSERSICERDQSTRQQEADKLRKFSSALPLKNRQTNKIIPEIALILSSQVYLSPPGQSTITWWTDYVFTPIMNMKHPSRFNSALWRLSTCPIAEQILAGSSRGRAHRGAASREGWSTALQWLAGH